eukprot:gene9447-9527_t
MPLACGLALADQKGALIPGASTKEPVTIEADKLDYFDKEQKAIYTGNVIAKQGESTLMCSVLNIFIEKNAATTGAAPSESSQISRMEADGPVKVTQKDQVGTGDHGTYDKTANKLYLIGHVTLMQGKNITTGDRLVYDLTTGQAAVAGGRVKGVFTHSPILPKIAGATWLGGLWDRLRGSSGQTETPADVSFDYRPSHGTERDNFGENTLGVHHLGTIELDGYDVTQLPMYRRARLGIGYLPQEASIFRGLSVEDNINAILEMTEPDADRRAAELDSLLDEFEIKKLRKSPSIALSGGERRRCEIARALAGHPSFVLLDEPFAGIDPIAVGDIRALVRHLTARGIGVLITDHNVRETLGLIDRGYIISSGHVLTEGNPEEIVANKDVRRLYLGEDFRL